eukprot:COSAG05_NODE_22792_length_262_cov_0.638037_1_plen_87_part_11
MAMLRDGQVHGAKGDGHADGNGGDDDDAPWDELPDELETDGIRPAVIGGRGQGAGAKEIWSLIGAEATVRSATELLRQAASRTDADG